MIGLLTHTGVRTLLIPFVLLGLASSTAAQSSFEVVHFPSSAGAEAEQATGDAKRENGAPLWGHLARPPGPGPHPAIVLLHGCGGILQSHFDWARTLTRAGFVTLVVDSFRPRSLIGDCAGGSAAASPAGRILDAYGALDFLSSDESVDPDRVGLVGWSHGGITALEATNTKGLGSRFEKSFQAVAAIYPNCIPDRNFALAVMVLIGEKDDWASAAECRKLENHNKERENAIDLVIYPGAFHAFDKPSVGSGFLIPGAPGQRHWLQYDPKAHSDAKRRLISFFEENL